MGQIHSWRTRLLTHQSWPRSLGWLAKWEGAPTLQPATPQPLPHATITTISPSLTRFTPTTHHTPFLWRWQDATFWERNRNNLKVHLGREWAHKWKLFATKVRNHIFTFVSQQQSSENNLQSKIIVLPPSCAARLQEPSFPEKVICNFSFLRNLLPCESNFPLLIYQSNVSKSSFFF